jgi:mono/diheme cytochrome c family protein
MKKTLGLLGWMALLFLAACSGGSGDEGGGGRTTDATTPQTDAVTVAGEPVQRFFAQNCSACHGPQREGRVGPALTPDRLTQDDAFYVDTIANGRTGTAMPAWSSKLDAGEIDALVHWLKTTDPGGD